ncbi:hypothetical protein AGABI1DRAFT_114418 [Agaricus bisporus var. burnettii JB137-S8]|uniref:Major facilitator superfamily (MFS) profile domain-containing protein n=1 Tax=Agaricus bisporus var. burnettii (strain JB137-S8 / ATCC MYA-4627 / FGSC 10392) TaxID=597362 RepID=K5XUQ2_AGABU|nr:uncharacterized protein AGABI1DRAFT_114418 [Agaricus bisporus var. burnettii JB137-S8]EKM78840.1 hypothetical protein AGABI1DRAFT_114418 [Agaricus bisporus var. burnettii JB137-S8]
MASERQAEELPSYKYAYILTASACLGSVFHGWDVGLIGGILSLRSFQEYLGINTKNAVKKAILDGNIISVLQAGCFFGALGTGYLSSRFGRRLCLIASGIVYITGGLLQCTVGLGPSQAAALHVFYIGRFISGIGVGMVSTLVPLYISECVPRTIRGRCTGTLQFATNSGLMLGFWVNYSVSKNVPLGEMQWRIPLIIQMIPSLLFIIAMFFQPESPRWLVEHGKHKEAATVLARTGGKDVDHPSVVQTLEEIKQEFVASKQPSFLKQIRLVGESRAVALRCFIPPLVMFFQQWTGTNAINLYSPEVFRHLGIHGTSGALFATGVYGVVKVVSVALALTFAVERFGRKRGLIFGGIGQALMMFWLGGYSATHQDGTVSPASHVSIVALYLYGAFFSMGWGPLPWVVAGEVAPNHVRSFALSIAVGTHWLFGFVISKVTPIMLDRIKYGTFLLFGFCCMIVATWAYFCLPETSGFALEDIKYLFERDVMVRSLQDAPGGKIFLGGRRVESIASLKERRVGVAGEQGEKITGLNSELEEVSSKKSTLKETSSV